MILQKTAHSSILWDYIALTKPSIVGLLVLTALGAMFLAAKGLPQLTVALSVIVGGALAAGGANAINHYLDRDIDGIMSRTRLRPLPNQRVQPELALIFGIVLNVVAFLILSLWVNLLSALLALSATLYYVFVYTLWLKRSSPQNIVIGGAAGAMPPLVGWAAITGQVDLPALYLFAIIFFWTPPHFWALSLLLRGDYARAGVPMLPVVTSEEDTKKAMLLHTIILVAVSILFFTTRAVGWFYLLAAVSSGLIFLLMLLRLLRTNGIKQAKQVYLYSLAYLALLFTAIILDSIL